MKLRTTVFVWVFALVVIVLGATIAAVTLLLEGSTRDRVAAELERSRDVTLDLHTGRQSLHRQECRVIADEPRVKAVVASEDVPRETILDAVRTLAETAKAGVFLIVDAEGRLIADATAPEEEGHALGELPVVGQALAGQETAGVWIANGKPYQVAGCRLEFGARVVGALVIGHAIDDAFADRVARHTGGALIVSVDKAPATTPPRGLGAAEVAFAIDTVRAGKREIELGGTSWFVQVVPVPGYQGEHDASYVLLRSIDEALAPFRRMVKLLTFLVVAAALATLALALVLARQLARPIDALVRRTDAIAGGDLAPKPATGPTEVRTLGIAMDRMAGELDASRKALAEKERLARELEIAARIQTSILPRDLRVGGLEIAAKMMTATEVGGDYYDVLPVDGGCWLAIGDASGHGLTAGLVMMMVQSGVATMVRSNPDAHPRDVIRAMNTVLYDNIHDRLETERHMTLSLLRYRRSGEIVVAGAHMDAVAWRATERTTELLGTPGTFLAITQDIDMVNQEVSWRLGDGDVLILLSDGVTEAEDAQGRAFEYAGVQRVVEASAAGRPSVEAIRDRLFSSLLEHSPQLADDATIVVLRYTAPGTTGS